MREIKCRGINYETGKFVYGSYCRMISGARLYDAIIEIKKGKLIEYYIHDSKTIGQYTGLKDCNGVEIYEGDIVEVKRDNPAWEDPIYSHNEVKYIEAGFKMGEQLSLSNNYALISVSVIGNIHENQELLEGK